MAEHTTMTFETILTDTRGDGPRRTGLITLNRPKQLNALNDQLMNELGAAPKAFDADDTIGCIVVPAAELLETTLGVAETINQLGALSAMAVKECVNRAYEGTLSDGVLYERRLFQAMFATEDKTEGMDAFLAKRKAQFKQR